MCLVKCIYEGTEGILHPVSDIVVMVIKSPCFLLEASIASYTDSCTKSCSTYLNESHFCLEKKFCCEKHIHVGLERV